MAIDIAERELPRYKSHKEVWALKISGIDGNRLTFDDPDYSPITVAPKMFVRYTPVPGDYYVVYEDGYASFSPRQAFEEGYTRI